jgi:hypothetical protein
MFIIIATAINVNAKPIRIHLDDAYTTKTLDQAEYWFNTFVSQILDRHSYNGYEYDYSERHTCDIYTADGITYHVEIQEIR